MKDFASYSGSGKQGGQEDFTKQAMRLMKNYDGKNESELVRDIYARALAGKRDGSLTNEEIDAFYAQFAPMLDGAKRKKLQKIIEQLKKM